VVKVQYGSIDLIPSFYEALCSVAAERLYLEMIEPPPLEAVTGFQTNLMEAGGALYYAAENNRVVGWCDIFPFDNPRHSHRGGVGMGMLPEYRGQGLGRKLLEACLKKAKESGLEKAELKVYSNNLSGIALYKKCGFETEGLIKRYRKLDGQYFDAIQMGKFL
jgi:ribosomal protein S18 acetylase RimI-like enzyme